MTTPPYQPGPYGQPNQEPYGQGGGYGQYGQPQPPQHGQPQYGGQYGGQQPQYGQQPQQQPAQPQDYGATQQWPTTNYGGLGQGPPEPPRNKTPMIIAIVVIAVLVLGGGGVALYFATKGGDDNNQATEQTKTPSTDKTESSDEQTSDEETTTTEETSDEPSSGSDPYDAKTGDCIKVNQGGDTNADVEVVSCSADEAIYKVATREEVDTAECPNDQYVTYTEEGRLLLCLQLNVAKGDCLKVSDVDTRVECSDPGVTNTVLDVFDGVDDETRCAADAEEAITYPTPPLTVCLGGPQG